MVQFLSAAPGGPLPLSQVKDRVIQALAGKARVEQARAMIAAAGGSGDLAATAKRLKVELKNEGPVSRSGPLPSLSEDP